MSLAPASEKAALLPRLPARERRTLLVLAAIVLVWTLLMRRFGSGDVYAVMGPFALLVIAIVYLLRGRALRAWLEPHARNVMLGLVLGTIMTLATYPLFHLAVRVAPALRPTVRGLYRAANGPSLYAISWVAILVLAEELLFRGALLDSLARRMRPALAGLLSVTAYACAQLGSGSFIVFTLALACGAIWTLARRYTGSLVASTISHLIWTECVILLFPVI